MWEVFFSFSCKRIRASHKICVGGGNRLDGLLKSFTVSFPMTRSLESVQTKLTDLAICRCKHIADQLNQAKLPCSACSYCYLMSLPQLGTPRVICCVHLVVPQYLLAGSEKNYVFLRVFRDIVT